MFLTCTSEWKNSPGPGPPKVDFVSGTGHPSCYLFFMMRIFAILLLLLSSGVSGFAKEKYQHAGPIHLDRGGEKWAEKTLRHLTLEEKVGQLFMIWVRADFLNINSPVYLQLLDGMHKYHIGSF